MESFEKKDAKNQEKFKAVEDPAESPQRRYNKLYRERWQNRVVYGGSKNVKK